MKITIINGSPRKGNTYEATQLIKNEMLSFGEVEFTDLFLPQDMPDFCKGCMICLEKDEKLCPHSKYTLPILESITKADALIVTTPVYVLQATGAVKNFFDHYSFLFVVHRALPEMFTKKAFILSTTAGAGTRAAMKTIITCLKFWGVNKIYSLGIAMQAINFETMEPKRRAKFEHKIKNTAKRFYYDVKSEKKHLPYAITGLMFHFRRSMLKKDNEATSLDKRYWIEQNWFKSKPF
ncbi:MAG: NAD(P)H-dependent oxidoreductase [Oscillospiraceae bacterium]|nr:NAD(P)H-dependent oxidoreductase [Oscillospiraceae bacterium]